MVRRFLCRLLVSWFLLGGVVLGQSSDDWSLNVVVDRGQEFVYRGTFVEEGRYGSVEFRREYRLTSRAFVSRQQLPRMEIAFLTTFKKQDAYHRPRIVGDRGQSSSKLVSLWLDPKGRIRNELGKQTSVPLDGVPTVETGAFVELPKGRITLGQTWNVHEVGRPVQTWKLTSTERVRGKLCLVVEARQESPEWQQPRADRAGWLRRDKVWLSPQDGLAVRVKRTIERRDPARTATTHRSVLTYERESVLHYPGQLSSDRREEIEQAKSFAASLAPLVLHPSQNRDELETLLDKIDYHLERKPPTPYREAILQVQREAEAARKGKVAPKLPANNMSVPNLPTVATVGQPAPSFVSTSFTTKQAIKLQDWIGKPTLMVFYLPSSITSRSLLTYAQQMHVALPNRLRVVGLSVSNDVNDVLGQRKQLGLTFEMIHGDGLRQTYNIETTPKFILLDANGTVRETYLGWGQEIPHKIAADVRHLLAK